MSTGVKVPYMTGKNIYTSSEVARHLDLSTGMVRRYQMALESVLGEPLPRDRRTNGRLVDEVQLAQLSEARRRVMIDSRLSVGEALGQLYGTVTDAVVPEPLLPSDSAVQELLKAVVEELSALREEVTVLKGQNKQLEDTKVENENLSAEVEKAKKLNDYMVGELKRRRLEQEGRAPTFWELLFERLSS